MLPPMNETYRRALRAIGRAGGLARAQALTPARRIAIARKAAKARWAKVRAAKAAC